jgi:hypothetical protein
MKEDPGSAGPGRGPRRGLLLRLAGAPTLRRLIERRRELTDSFKLNLVSRL